MVIHLQTSFVLISGLICIIHANLNVTYHQLKRIFGSDYTNHIDNYLIEFPTKIEQNDGSYLILVPYQGSKYLFSVNRQNRLFGDEFHAVYKDENGSKFDTSLKNRQCVYNGPSLSHKNVEIALVGCGHDMHGMISLDNGEYVFINPAPKGLIWNEHEERKFSTSRPHIVHKRNAVKFTPMTSNFSSDNSQNHVTCLFDSKSVHNKPANVTNKSDDRLAILTNQPLTIEIGLFVDDQLWDHFKQIYGADADHEMENFIIATANNINLLYNHRSINPKMNLKIVRYEVLKSSPASLAPNQHRNGDVDLLLDAFCLYQQNLNPNGDSDPKHWDHALLFTGYDLYRGSVTSVAGYAPVKGMCSGVRSCTINEGMDFGSIFVITHEMGHSLGMYHDGDNGCDNGCCIMSPSLGTGKTHWSQCSNKEFNSFFGDLGTGDMPPQCLLDGADDLVPLDINTDGILPGQRYNLDQQCRIFHGDCWHHELRESQNSEDVCEMIWCGENEGLIRTAHPALEGTSCATGKWCIQGKCETFGRIKPFIVHGSWTSWNDFPKKDCGGECSLCQIDGQLSVRRSVRLCEKPAPNFGGETCKGASYRASLCTQQHCQSTVTPDQYALEKCNSLKAKDGKTTDMVLSGSGFQCLWLQFRWITVPLSLFQCGKDVHYDSESPCKVWCQVAFSGFIRAVNSFPDGTPCGFNKFCVKGDCMSDKIVFESLSCDGKALVASTNDCPQGTPGVDLSAEPWTVWSFWSACTKSCGLGLQSRSRSCTQSPCIGPNVQSVPCNVQQCSSIALWGEWSGWSGCSTTCGKGSQNRQRICKGAICYGSNIETRDCLFNPPCFSRIAKSIDESDAGFWTSWSTWSTCSATCVGGFQTKERICNTGGRSDCFGENSVRQDCNSNIQCGEPKKDLPKWSQWSSWSECSVSCGDGERRRSRECLDIIANNSCQGVAASVQSCKSEICEPSSQQSGKWGQWEEWQPCTRSKTRQRFRRCSAGIPCLLGEWSETDSCP